MELSTTNLTLTPNAAIDLHMHTVYSHGTWTPEDLLDHLKDEGFGLVAITDHDRVDMAVEIQQLAIKKQMPILVATEMTTSWAGGITDILCYGFDPENSTALHNLAQQVLHLQQENTREVVENLRKQGVAISEDELAAILAKPCSQHLNELVALAQKHGCENLRKTLRSAGAALKTNDTAAVVDAAHQCGAVCLIAHPGRTDGFCTFDVDMLDQFRKTIPVDGLEVYYPAHTPERVAMFQDYAQTHGLLVSSGSDSHNPDKKPIKYRAELSRALLERLGVRGK